MGVRTGRHGVAMDHARKCFAGDNGAIPDQHGNSL